MKTVRNFGLLAGLFCTLGVQNALFAFPPVPPFGVYPGASFSPTITVIESNADRLRLHLNMENLPLPSSINVGTRLPGLWGEMNETGILIPRIAILLALPNTGNPSVQIDDWQTVKYGTPHRTFPENNPAPARAIVDHVGILGGVRVVPLTIRPVSYTNSADSFSVISQATITINLDDQPGENPVTTSPATFSRPWQQVFRSTVSNWEDIPNIQNSADSHILLIVPNEMSAGLSSFIAWKEQRGFKVTVILKNSLGTNPSSLQIRNAILQAYETSSPKVDYVILVGDETKLAVHSLFTSDPLSRFSTETYSGSFTDEAFYSAIQGDDVFPDLFFGRWVVNTEPEVMLISKKVVAHEKNTFALDSARFERAAVSADWTESTQRRTKRFVAKRLMDAGFVHVDSLWGGWQVGPQSLISWVNSGVTFVNYRGSGWNNGWAGINFYTDAIPDLQNSGRLTIVTGIGCGVGKFDVTGDGSCFGEAWMLAGSLADPRGSVGFVGPCWNTHTVYNDNLDSLFYRAMLDYRISNLAPALAAGKMMEWTAFSQFMTEASVTEIMKTLFRQYLALCDPSLQVFTDTPQRLQVVMSEALPAGQSQLQVSVANMNQIAADSLLVTAWMGSGQTVSEWLPHGPGAVFLPLNTNPGDTVVVTLTGDNVLAAQRAIPVGYSGAHLMHQRAILDGGGGISSLEPGATILWTEVARNAGMQTAQSVEATLSCLSSDVSVLAPITVQFGDIASLDSATSQIPLHIGVSQWANPGRDIPFVLSWTIQGVPAQTDTIYLPIHRPYLATTSVTSIDADSAWNPGETISLEIFGANGGSADLSQGTAQLVSLDPDVSVMTGTSLIGPVTQGGSFNLPSASFQVQASAGLPLVRQVLLRLNVTAVQGASEYPFAQALPILLSLGSIEMDKPFSDQLSHYWIYDDNDIQYAPHPALGWLEIAPSAGGAGTHLNVVSSDTTIAVTVPFSYQYYGQTFASLSVSSDGWVCPGASTQSAYFSRALPIAGDGISGMIAVLWNDLWYRSGDFGEVCTYHDAVTHRFIVEWTRIHDWATGFHEETFQLQLLDPIYFPTEGGDAEWVMLYQHIAPVHLQVHGATVGMENPAETAGFDYLVDGMYASGATPLHDGGQILVTAVPPVIDAAEPLRPTLPENFSLSQNYPNPFNPSTLIEFSLPRAADVHLRLFNIMGQQVASLVNSVQEAGSHRVIWNGTSDSGLRVASGLYLCVLETPAGTFSRKLLLLK